MRCDMLKQSCHGTYDDSPRCCSALIPQDLGYFVQNRNGQRRDEIEDLCLQAGGGKMSEDDKPVCMKFKFNQGPACMEPLNEITEYNCPA